MRKKIQTILLLVVGTVTLSQAQTLIPKIGLSLATLDTKESSDPANQYSVGNKTGYTFGVAYNIPVSIIGSKVGFSLQPEATYIQKGFKGKNSGEFQIGEAYYQFTGSNEHTINYFEVPVLAKFEYGGDKLKIAAYAGPSIGFALGGKYKVKSDVDTGEGGIQHYDSSGKIVFYHSNQHENTVEFDHNIDFGVQGGVSLTFFNHLALDLRYGKGLTDLNHASKSKNNVMQVTIGVPIHL